MALLAFSVLHFRAMKILTVRLPDALVAEIEAEARRRMISKSDVVRERLTRPVGKRSTAALDQIADLVGSIEGLAERPEREPEIRPWPQAWIVDAGFLVALLSSRDVNHGWAAAQAAPPAAALDHLRGFGRGGIRAVGAGRRTRATCAARAPRRDLPHFQASKEIAPLLKMMAKYDSMSFEDRVPGADDRDHGRPGGCSRPIPSFATTAGLAARPCRA